VTVSPAVRRRPPARRLGTVTVDIVGTDLPGGTCGPDMDGEWYENVRVGLARGTDTIELVPADAASARWTFAIEIAIDEDGRLDQRGAFVHGPRGERHLGLRWLRRDAEGHDVVFRGAKFRLFEMDSGIFEQALAEGRRLVGRLGLTDEQGWPRCATVRPPVIQWTVA
jgi:Family of unknown function (DUF5990)